jgi:hypothetical protein
MAITDSRRGVNPNLPVSFQLDGPSLIGVERRADELFLFEARSQRRTL